MYQFRTFRAYFVFHNSVSFDVLDSSAIRYWSQAGFAQFVFFYFSFVISFALLLLSVCRNNRRVVGRRFGEKPYAVTVKTFATTTIKKKKKEPINPINREKRQSPKPRRRSDNRYTPMCDSLRPSRAHNNTDARFTSLSLLHDYRCYFVRHLPLGNFAGPPLCPTTPPPPL